MESQDILVWVIIAAAVIYIVVAVVRAIRRINSGGDKCSDCNCDGGCGCGESHCDKNK